MNNEYNYPYLFNPGIMSGKVSDVIHQDLLVHLSRPASRENPLENSTTNFHLPFNDALNDYLSDMYMNWCKAFEVEYNVMDVKVWTQVLRRGENAPFEMNREASTSFVLWVKIPEQGERFVLTYSQMNGALINNPIEVDKSYEGTIIMFPAGISYSVFQFADDNEERIAICGNMTRSVVGER